MSARPTADQVAEARAAMARDCFGAALLAEIDALTVDLKRATTKPSVEAGELVVAVLNAFGIDEADSYGEDSDIGAAERLIQRALDAAEERGAEAEREQRDIERRHGVGR